MLLAFLSKVCSWSRYAFVSGLCVALGFALFASITEMLRGDACPQTPSGLPMCYASLALCVYIGLTWFVFKNKN